MTTDLPGTRPAPPPTKELVVEASSTSAPVTNQSGVSGVAIYDRGPDEASDPSAHSSVSVFDNPEPASQSGGRIVAWVIGIVVLIVLVYYLLQFLV